MPVDFTKVGMVPTWDEFMILANKVSQMDIQLNPPSITLSIAPMQCAPGTQVTLSWTAKNIVTSKVTLNGSPVSVDAAGNGTQTIAAGVAGDYPFSVASLDALGNPVVSNVVTLKVQDAPLPSRYFDFGPATSPVAANYVGVSKSTTYTPELGYGWTAGTIDERDRAKGDDRQRDFCFMSDGTFQVDLPNGDYTVVLDIGDESIAHDQQGIFLQGVQVDSIDSAAGTPVTKSYPATVSDGHLVVRFKDLGGADKNVCVASMDVTPSGPPQPLQAVKIMMKNADGSTSPIPEGGVSVAEGEPVQLVGVVNP